MKQSGLKVLFDSFFETSLINSHSFGTLINNVRLVALETKKLAEIILTLKQRMDKHENMIMGLYEQKGDDIVLEYTKQTKPGASKPN